MPSIAPSLASPQPAYLPPLEKVVSGDTQLLSWDLVHEALTNSGLSSNTAPLQRLLEDELSIKSIAQCLQPEKPANGQTKADFENRTAAINVAPSDAGEYDINQIKDDALWLSKLAGIDEVVALRNVVLEWQGRTASQVLDGYTEEEVLSLQQADGSLSNFGGSLLGSSFGRSITTNKIAEQDTKKRQSRILHTWLREHERLLAVAVYLQTIRVLQHSGRPEWLTTVAAKVSSARGGAMNADQSASQSLEYLMEAFERQMKNLGGEDMPELPVDTDPVVLAAQQRGRLLETIHLLRLIYVEAKSNSHLRSVAAITHWYRLMDTYAFLHMFEVAELDQQSLVEMIQSLAALISVQLLDFAGAYKLVSDDSAQDARSWYLFDNGCCRQITKTIEDAAKNGNRIAAPAVLCWAIIGKAIRRQPSDSSSRRLSLDSEDGARSPSLSRSDGTPLGDVRQVFSEIEIPIDMSDKEVVTKDPTIYLAEAAIFKLDVYGLVAGLSFAAKSLWGPGLTDQLEFEVRQTLLNSVRQGVQALDYGAELLGAAIAVLRPEATVTGPSFADRAIANEFLADSLLMESFLSQALVRYPYEVLPLLELCKALSAGNLTDEDGMPILTKHLEVGSQFTLQMPQSFNDYELIRDRRSDSAVRLTKDLVLFTTARSSSSFLQRLGSSRDLIKRGMSSSLSIPAGTQGLVRTDRRPFIATWLYEHSILSYMASLLATAVASNQSGSVVHQGPLPRDLQAGTIRLFATQVQLLLRDATDETSVQKARSQARELLAQASEALPQDCDVLSVIGDILEIELAAQPLQSDDDSIDILESCVAFMQATLPVLPDRVWPLLTRIGLIDTLGQSGKLNSVVASIEIASGRYTFLLACLKLYNALVMDVVQNAIVRTGIAVAPSNRFSESPSYETGIPSKMVAQIIESFTRLFMEVLRSAQDWRFADVNEHLKINHQTLQVFQAIVRTVYGYDDSREAGAKLFGALAPAAKMLLQTHCEEAGDLSIHALIRQCMPSSEASLDTFTTTAILIRKQSDAALHFLTLLLQVGDLNGASLTGLKRHLFQAVPALVRIYISKPSQRIPVAELLTALVAVGGKAEGKETPSLFGHLGASTAQKVIAILSQLGKPLDDERLETSLWKLFSAAVSSKQQWFATFLLTGSVPNKSYRTAAIDKTNKRKAVLDQALDALAASSTDMRESSASILQFVNDAINNWPWSIARLKSHPTFVESMMVRLYQLDNRPGDVTRESCVPLAWQTRNVSLLSELFAMYIHHMRRMGDLSFGKKLADTLYFFNEDCTQDPSYAGSLHHNLTKNLQAKLPALRLQSFKCLLPTRGFGPDYVYDVDFAGQALATHVLWADGKPKGSFAADLRSANYNLSLVEAQIQNIKSLKLLAIEFSSYAKDDKTLQKKLAALVHRCLTANRNAPLEAVIFESLAEIRAEISLPILQRLIDHRVQIPEIHALLAPAWNAVLATEQDFDATLPPEDAGYNRLLLRLLLLSLQPHTYSIPSNESSDAPADQVAEADKVSILVAICRDIVARGFKSLCSQVHEQPFNVLPSDFTLLTTIFQSVMRVRTRELSGLETRVATVLTEQGVTRYATSLFSWSDRLTAANDDPIYGEISMNFLHEMSCIPAVAEMLAAEGILAQINAANITAQYRRKLGTGPFDEPIRLHAIWSRGILPVCLNVLVAAGESFSSEVVTFLNNFAPQLERASASLDPKGSAASSPATAGCITLNSACEAHTMALITTALQQSGQDDAVLLWDRAAVKEDAEGWVHGTRAALRERILPTTEKELALQHASALSKDGDSAFCKNRLEEMVLLELTGALFVLSGGS